MEVDLVASGISEEDSFQLQNYTNDDSNFEGERCGICMDIIIDRGVLDCCQHWFCFVCIDNWATITNLCPLCQSEFQLITCVPVYDTIGSNKVDEDSFSRDDDWCIEGKSNTLSFPSYYIDENAVICLDEDGCKIRTGSATIEGDSNLDTSIACDSCDIWYHALCVGFDPEGTSEDTWLCPRCVNNELPQKSDVISIQRTNNQCGSENANGECLAEAAFSGKVSVSVADAGETAVVISMVDGNQYTEGLSEDFLSTFEVDKAHKNKTLNPDSSNLKVETASSERTNIQSALEAQELKLSLSHDTSSSLPSNSLIVGQLKTSCPGKALNEPSTSNGVRISLRKSFHEFCSTNKLSESDSSMGLHLGLSVGSFLSVDGMNNDGTEDQVTGDVQQQNLSEESLSKADEILPDAKEDASRIIGVKRTHADCSEDVHMSAEDKETKAKNEPEVLAKKIKHEVTIQTTPSKDEANASTADDPQKCPSRISVSKNDKLKHCPEKEDVTFDILGIVQGTGRRPSKGLASRNSADKTSKEGDNLAGLRVKKILRRPADDKESSMVVQELRKRIREAVRNKSSKDIGENLFDPKLLAAFRAAIAGPKTEPVRNLSPSAVKVKKSMLQKGKIRENLTKKIYGNSNGRRKRAWDRDCEVEFWKHRSMRATKPEKIETLKSVLDLLRKNSGSAEIETASEGQATNPILSRLYLADTSVFPRKEDIKPLSALKATGNSEQNKEVSSVKNSSNPSLDNCIVKIIESNKLSSKVGVPSPDDKGSKTNVPSSKVNAASSKVHPHRRPGGSSASPSGDFKVKSQKEMGVKSDDVKIDKRKWALEVLARKSALEVKPAMHEKQEDNAVLKGNYPLLAQLPADMRPVLAPSRHNKIPVSVRQTQLFRLTEHFLRKANLPVIRRTAETELAVADAINIEKEVADRSNSKVVYMNLCSQEILHRSDNSKSIKAPESNSSPQSAVPVDGSEQATEDLSIDPVVVEALRAAGLLSDSPPNSPHHKMEVTGEVDDSSLKINEEGPDNVFEMDSHPEVDIYGDFEYDLEDEDYIGASVLKAKLQPEETVSKVKVLFSTLNSESSNNALDLESYGRLGNVEVPKDSTSLLKTHTDVAIGSSTVESGTVKSCLPPESLPVEEGEELSVAECEELYGPDKEPLINKFPEGASQNGLVAADPSVNKDTGNNENYVSNHNASGGVNSPDDSQTGDNVPRKEKKSNTDANKQCDGVNSVTKKVEAYVKEHIRPLCKSGVITAEQYRWAVAKTTDKVMKYHLNAKSANFLIKEGEKVKKLAEQYVEAAQQGKM